MPFGELLTTQGLSQMPLWRMSNAQTPGWVATLFLHVDDLVIKEHSLLTIYVMKEIVFLPLFLFKNTERVRRPYVQEPTVVIETFL